MHLIVTGATGLVGTAVLQHMLATKSITKVSILSRREVPLAQGQEKAEVIIHKDFDKYPSDVLDKLKGADGCVWALGISQSQVTKEQYERITFDYAMAAAKAFAGLKDPFKFVYVSGEGATETPGRFTPLFGGVKGRAERALREFAKTTPSFKPYSARPGGVDPSQQPEILPFIPRRQDLKSRAFGYLEHAVKAVIPKSMLSPTADLGRALVELAMSDGQPLEGEGVSGEGRTISNVGLRRLAGI
ncbi:MAG: hypothetical protein M1818_007460 [Claussenomyces sp. TS43310]|nr:MAG: hypothetical protein M1818_007460 [Claussenomyces sp. TS43310]